MRLVREVLAAEETRHGTDIAGALRFLNNVQKRQAVVFLISDFMDHGYEQELRVTARQHDVICCPISDPRESGVSPTPAWSRSRTRKPATCSCSTRVPAPSARRSGGNRRTTRADLQGRLQETEG